jgi:hypothetical protein
MMEKHGTMQDCPWNRQLPIALELQRGGRARHHSKGRSQPRCGAACIAPFDLDTRHGFEAMPRLMDSNWI